MARRIPELDGLRGVAIVLVVAAHAWNGIAPNRSLRPFDTVSGGGLFGVHLFFVLSGFLITRLLLEEFRATGGISLPAFYGRRARRLLPALFVLVAFYGLVRVRDAGGVGDMVRALLYIENLRPVVDRIPHHGWLDHTWTLAVEEQFYLAWPVLLLLALRRSTQTLIGVASAVIVITLALRHGLDSASTVLRWDALMLGCLLAIVKVRLPRPVGWAAFAVLLGSVVWIPSFTAVPTTIATVTSGLALCAALEMPWLARRPLPYLGRISYGLYLWHVVIMRFGGPVVPSIALSIVVADLSHRIIEQPFLRHRSGVKGEGASSAS